LSKIKKPLWFSGFVKETLVFNCDFGKVLEQICRYPSSDSESFRLFENQGAVPPAVKVMSGIGAVAEESGREQSVFIK